MTGIPMLAIVLISFVAGLITAPFIAKAIMLFKWQSRPIPEYTICAHCRKIIGNQMDHWRHPARTILEDIRKVVSPADTYIPYDYLAQEIAEILDFKNERIIELTERNSTVLSLLDAADMGHQSLFKKIKELEAGIKSQEWLISEIIKALDVPDANPALIGETIAALQQKAAPMQGISNPDNQLLRKTLEEFASCVLSVRLSNTPEWMDYITGELNKVCELLDKEYRFEYRDGKFWMENLLKEAA